METLTEIQTIKVIQADCLKAMAKMPAESIDCLVTDPPYGLSFMGKDWDKAVPSVSIWKECLRILKSGAFAFIMSSPRMDCLSEMGKRLEQAGFEVGFTPIFWTYATGFPKATNMGKAVDRKLGAEREIIGQTKSGGFAHMMKTNQEQGFRPTDYYAESGNVFRSDEPATDQAKPLDGSYAGFQPKPAVEVIIVAMKPLSEKTYVDQALKNGKGVTWLDDGRIPFVKEGEDSRFYTGKAWKPTIGGTIYGGGQGIPPIEKRSSSEGRFPANLLVSDDVLNDGIIHSSTKSTKLHESYVGESQTGLLRGISSPENQYDDAGSFSRYFDLDAWAQKTFPFLIVPKASTSERDEDINGDKLFRQRENVDPEKDAANDMAHAYGARNAPRKNFHPTVKPVKLMAYLITLGSREGDTILDPFVGSGTTLVAARNLNRNGIGIEIDPKFAKIALERVNKLQYLDRQTKYEFEVVDEKSQWAENCYCSACDYSFVSDTPDPRCPKCSGIRDLYDSKEGYESRSK